MTGTDPTNNSGAEGRLEYDPAREHDISAHETSFDEKPPFDTIQDVDAVVHELAEKLGDNQDGLAPVDDIEYVMDKIELLTVQDCREYLSELLVYHEYDYNMAVTQREKYRLLLEGPLDGQSTQEWELELKTETAVAKYYSPYPEVRAVTTPTDDPSIACETIRAHLLGYLWACIAQFTNSLFSQRLPAISLSSVVIQVLLYPCGLLCALILPDWGFNLGGQRISLNPGPWTYKEQMLATIIIDVGLATAYCFSNIQVQALYYQDKWLTPGYGILLLLSTQMMGLGFSGLLRRFVIYPVESIWPSVLPTLALNRALLVKEKKETVHGWSISRYKFFFIAFVAMFCYFWLPGFLFTALSTFAWMCWIAPNNFNLNLITGSQTGMGFNPIPTFDWNVISQYSQPLAYPFFSTAQQYLGSVLAGLIIIAVYYSNTNYAAYLPINSSGVYDNTGNSYNVSRVVDSNTGALNVTAYLEYSPAYYSAANIVLYGAFFAFYPMTMVFILLDAWRPLLRAFKSAGKAAGALVKNTFIGLGQTFRCLSKGQFREAGHTLMNLGNDGTSMYDEFDNPLTNLLRSYPEVPDWWFLIVALISFIIAIIIVVHWPELDTPVWTVFFVVAINLVFLIPMSYLYAISGTTEGLNVITELVIGYALPGHPEALMFVKAFGYNINGQADNYISDQKMGYYSKVPPRAMYRGQMISAVITSIVCYGVVQFVDNDIPGICTPDQVSNFTCAASSLVFYSSSVVWGAIGPKRIFGEIYPILKYCFLIGFLLSIVWWGFKRYGGVARTALRNTLPGFIFKPFDIVLFTPISWLQQVHPSLLLNGFLIYAPLNLTYYTVGLYFSFGFMYYLRRYKTAWWEKYNYLLSAGLSGGVAFSAIIIFFAVQYKNPVTLNWWGDNVNGETIDGGAGQSALLSLATGETFGPQKWY